MVSLLLWTACFGALATLWKHEVMQF